MKGNQLGGCKCYFILVNGFLLYEESFFKKLLLYFMGLLESKHVGFEWEVLEIIKT